MAEVTGNPYMSLETSNVKSTESISEHMTYALVAEQNTNIRNMNRIQESLIAYWGQQLHTLGPMEARSQVAALTQDATAQQAMAGGVSTTAIGQWGALARAMVPQPVYVVGGYQAPHPAPVPTPA